MSNKYLVVIVEDEYNISSFVSAVLQANGFDTMVARNGAEAIILITSHCPDLVLLDLGLPDMDGQGIIENVRGWSNGGFRTHKGAGQGYGAGIGRGRLHYKAVRHKRTACPHTHGAKACSAEGRRAGAAADRRFSYGRP